MSCDRLCSMPTSSCIAILWDWMRLVLVITVYLFKQPTINDLGAAYISSILYFSRNPGSLIHLRNSREFFFPGEGPPIFFSLNYLRPHPQIINGRPLSIFQGFKMSYKLRGHDTFLIILCKNETGVPLVCSFSDDPGYFCLKDAICQYYKWSCDIMIHYT